MSSGTTRNGEEKTYLELSGHLRLCPLPPIITPIVVRGGAAADVWILCSLWVSLTLTKPLVFDFRL